ncbi:hypothetical protein B1H58_20475 (plasmid) [Pantoea alhagi]|uniref:Conjugal transfer protein TraS n=1 Tax=Pantoea alhagi TaxID=1891675 RepID=A0A1W6BBH3_9GAMM|nr:hypothetical protein [Pantoea alhagi]ARJ44399.1 hypothetical protein B1H58_20475 [Pantoea alhagi]
MKMTYGEVKKDAGHIIEAMASSNREVPSFFHPLKRISMHLFLFLFFCGVDYALFDNHKDGATATWLFSFGFGVVNWIFLLAFFYGYENIFIMLSDARVSELKLVKLIRRKVKMYGSAWFILIALLGLMSMFDKLNIDILVFGNFLTSLLLLFIFSVDMSRYQISALIGAVSASVKKINL